MFGLEEIDMAASTFAEKLAGAFSDAHVNVRWHATGVLGGIEKAAAAPYAGALASRWRTKRPRFGVGPRGL